MLEASGCITHTADALALASLSISVEIRAENAPYQGRMPLRNRTQVQLKEGAESEEKVDSSEMKFLCLLILSTGAVVSSPYSEAFSCTIIHFQPSSFRPNLIPVSQRKNDQRSASDRLR